MPLSSEEVVDKQLTQFFKGTHGIRRYLAKPYSCWSFEGSKEGPTHNLVRNPLKMHRSLESSKYDRKGHEFHHKSPRKAS